MSDLSELQERIGHSFQDVGLLEMALTPSFAGGGAGRDGSG